MQDTAQASGISLTQLRKRLSAEGYCYRDLVRQYKYDLSKKMLRDQRATIKEIAFELGYRDHNSFRRAFKVWSGSQPYKWAKSTQRTN